MPLRFDEKLVLMANEPTYLAAVALDASHYHRLFDVTITPEQETVTDEVAKPFEGADEDIIYGEHVTITFKVYVVCSGTAGVAPPLSTIFLSCRMAEVVEADTRVRYVIAADQGLSAAMTLRIGSNLHDIKGLRGKADLVFEKGIPVFNVSMKGTWAAPTHDANAFPAVDQSPWLGFQPTGPGRTSNFSLHGQTARAYSLSMGTGNEPIYDESLTDSQIVFDKRDAAGKVKIEAPTLDTINFFSRASNRQHGALAIQHGQTAGSIFKLSCPRVQNKKPSYTRLDNGNVGYEMDLKLLPDAGNDEYEFIFE